VTPGFAGLERRNDVGHNLVGRDHPILCAMPLQEAADIRRRFAHVAAGVWARAADEPAQIIEQHLASQSLSIRCNSSALRPSIPIPRSRLPVKRSGN